MVAHQYFHLSVKRRSYQRNVIFNSFRFYTSMKLCIGNKLKQINQLILEKFSVMHTINVYLAALMKDLRSTAPVFYKQYFTNSGYTTTWKSLHFITSKNTAAPPLGGVLCDFHVIITTRLVTRVCWLFINSCYFIMLYRANLLQINMSQAISGIHNNHIFPLNPISY